MRDEAEGDAPSATAGWRRTLRLLWEAPIRVAAWGVASYTLIYLTLPLMLALLADAAFDLVPAPLSIYESPVSTGVSTVALLTFMGGLCFLGYLRARRRQGTAWVLQVDDSQMSEARSGLYTLSPRRLRHRSLSEMGTYFSQFLEPPGGLDEGGDPIWDRESVKWAHHELDQRRLGETSSVVAIALLALFAFFAGAGFHQSLSLMGWILVGISPVAAILTVSVEIEALWIWGQAYRGTMDENSAGVHPRDEVHPD